MSATPKIDAAINEARTRALTAFEEKDALGMLAAETTRDLMTEKAAFVNDAVRLANRLLYAAQKVENNPLDHWTLNSLGEVQGSGQDLDRLCARIAMYRETLAAVESARKAAAR